MAHDTTQQGQEKTESPTSRDTIGRKYLLRWVRVSPVTGRTRVGRVTGGT